MKNLLFPMALLIVSCAYAHQLAFPTTEGYGKFAKGGRRGAVH
ncbi:hypothetical protein [Echinicola rosea]|nr:hypothetical protein [Echinicola rosea]